MKNYYYSYYNGGIYTAKELKEFGCDEGGELIGKFKSREDARKYFFDKYGREA